MSDEVISHAYAQGMNFGVMDANSPKRYAFTEEEYKSRQDRLRELMRRDGFDMLWITTPEAVCYLHGYYSGWYKSNSPMRYPQCYGTMLDAHSDRMIHFDSPQEVPLLNELSVCKDNRYYPAREGAPNLEFIMNELRKEGLLHGTVGMEFWSGVPNRAISEWFEAAFRKEGCTVKDCSAIVREVRRVKSPAELEVMREAIAICDVAHQAILENGHAGMTELELQGIVNLAMNRVGGEMPSQINIFSGQPMKNGRPCTRGHCCASTRVLQKDDVLLVDLVGVKHRYHGNVERGYYFGKATQEMIELYDKVGEAFTFLHKNLHANMTVRDVIGIMRPELERLDLMKEDGWLLSYELGLSLPNDWVGEFYWTLFDTDPQYIDRVIPENFVSNMEILFNTAMIDTLIWHKDGIEDPTKTPRKLFELPG